MMARIERVVTSGVFSIDGEDFDVENNVWIVGDDEEVVVVDAAHDAQAILAAVGERDVLAVVCTHGHNDHIGAAVEVAEATGSEIALHPADGMFWEQVHPDDVPDIEMAEGGWFDVAGVRLDVLHTPGHSPGAVSLHVPDLEVVFTGDTLFQGGPGATGRSHSDFPTILASIKEKLLVLPNHTRVLTGHGDETTIGAEAPDYDAWVARGH
ncbi:MBL fold metallo-hydrolase [Vallicoccus soli]|uniref:MBL fold metallo-hydrolase n=1 Tax=Vallicoccus soli TaxID=2339232 RepID=A0A3A3Z2C8_9ACTN|nr:MBL fold metallo-hydrolase [Vallicoccus soli]